MKSKYKIEEHINEQINNWKILSFSHVDSKSVQYWNCQCKCGNLQAVRTTHLMRNKTKNCKHCRKQCGHNKDNISWKGGDFISSTIHTFCRLRAKNANIPFNITIKDLEDQWLKQEGKCAYTKFILTLPDHNRSTDFNASIDRIDSSKGYEIGNIQWVIKKINVMKNEYSEEEFLNLCKIVTENNENK